MSFNATFKGPEPFPASFGTDESMSADFDEHTTIPVPGPPGPKGDDGFSPVISVTDISGGHRVSITTATGTDSFDVLNGETGSAGAPGKDGKDGAPGKDGDPGQDGFSPSASVSKSGNVATISVTDKDGTTTASISDGETGPEGPAGPGVPSGGSTGDVLVKHSDDDYDGEWKPLTASDVGALSDDTKYAGSPSGGGPANEAIGLPYGVVDGTSTATAFTVTIPGITELRDGLVILVKNNVVASKADCTLNVNGLGAKRIHYNSAANSQITTQFSASTTALFYYDSTRNSGAGAWVYYYGYDSNTNTIGYQLRTNSFTLPMTSITYRYRLLFQSADNAHFVPATNSTSTNATASRTVCQDPINPFGMIVYYGTTASVAAGSRPSAAYLWNQYTLALGYSFNRTGEALTLSLWKPVYVKCAPQANGSAIIDSTTPFVQDLPTTEDGYIYIFLGVAYSETNIELALTHPVYYYKNSGIRLWTGG